MADPRGARSGTGALATAFDAASTRDVLHEACRSQSLSADGAVLLRLGENAIYQLRDVPIVVRIARRPDTCAKELAVARWLGSSSFPAARVVEELEQLLVAGGRTVTWWHLIESSPEPLGFVDLSRMLRRLHDLPQDRNAPRLPPFDPMPLVLRRLDAATAGASDDIEYLRDRYVQLLRRYESLRFVLPAGPVHGDAHVGNLMRDRDGVIHLIDFEAFAHGPREWDVTVVGAAYRGFGWMAAGEYGSCVAEYGWDVTEWSGFSTMRAVRELNMTSWLIQRAGESPELDAEIQRRVADLRDDQAPRRWGRF